jgi:hypothetical protein
VQSAVHFPSPACAAESKVFPRAAVSPSCVFPSSQRAHAGTFCQLTPPASGSADRVPNYFRRAGTRPSRTSSGFSVLSSYNTMASINPPGPLYSPTHPYDSSYKYDEPIDPQIPRGYPDQFTHLPQSVPQHPGPPPRRESQLSQGGQSRSGDAGPKQRLRKACDSCSVRKVKV